MHAREETGRAGRRTRRTQALREELYERFIRAAEGERENEERAARLAAEQMGQTVPNPAETQFSGNYEPGLEGFTRIGGRIVKG